MVLFVHSFVKKITKTNKNTYTAARLFSVYDGEVRALPRAHEIIPGLLGVVSVAQSLVLFFGPFFVFVCQDFVSLFSTLEF